MADQLRGRDLRQERLRAKLSQAQLAERMGVHKSLISAAETELTGEYPSPEWAARFVVACVQAQNVASAA